jgi:hypothetical protein
MGCGEACMIIALSVSILLLILDLQDPNWQPSPTGWIPTFTACSTFIVMILIVWIQTLLERVRSLHLVAMRYTCQQFLKFTELTFLFLFFPLYLIFFVTALMSLTVKFFMQTSQN